MGWFLKNSYQISKVCLLYTRHFAPLKESVELRCPEPAAKNKKSKDATNLIRVSMPNPTDYNKNKD